MKATSEELAIFVAVVESGSFQPGGRAAWTGQFRCQPGS
ncbi:Uncharacterised protein [Salmonella enterica subsp. enterica]|uniref:LysR family transcriptional regulator n=1 Tax=Salmonella enterica I TaxID=59201 RepID=A0A3S4I7T6_SALET|nr:Uncharacterised protein [Salmonella enterica subsp. enterica]